MSFHRLSLITAVVLSCSGGVAVAASTPEVNSDSNPRIEQQLAQIPDASFRGRAKDNHGGRKPDFMEQLDLSSDQEEELQAIRNRYQSQMESTRDELRAAHEALQELLSNDEASTRALQSQHRQVQALQQDLGELRFNSMLEMREVLTPQQRQELSQLMDERRRDHPSRSERRTGGGVR